MLVPCRGASKVFVLADSPSVALNAIGNAMTRAQKFSFVIPSTWLLILLTSFSLVLSPPSKAFAEDVIFIVPGSSDPSVTPSFDPQLQIIQKGQSIVFVNADGLDHQLIIKSPDGKEEFDTGILNQNKFVSHTFSENGKYTIQDQKYSHMKGEILVSDDIATFTKTIENQGLDVQLARTPSNVGVNEEVYYKITFINKETGRNHQHIDFTLTFNDSAANYVDGVGGHTVDGQEFARFKFDKEDSFTPRVTVSGIDFIPIRPEKVTFETVVTPEFPGTILGLGIAASFAVTMALTRRKMNPLSP